MNAPLRIGLDEPLRSLFLSDLHLGSAHCHAGALADFLEQTRCRKLYLVGDIIDLWWLSARRATWGSAQHRVMDCLHAMARAGTEIIYIPGNHDSPARRFCGLMLPRMKVRRRAIHVTADGRRLLVTHGDEFDGETRLGGFHEWFGDKLYYAILTFNQLTNRARRVFGLRYWSLADFLKRRSGAAERYMERYVAAALGAAARRGLDGIVCGHIHRPALLEHDGLIYANDGDWVESLTALAEDPDGTLRLIRWTGRCETVATLAARVPASEAERVATLIAA